MFLVDSSVWLDILTPLEHRADLRERVVTLVAQNLVATTPVVTLELLRGARTRTDYDRLLLYLSALITLPITDQTWEDACLLAFELRRKGVNAPSTDLIIASVAIQQDVIVMHRDRHFDLIAEASPLRVESCVR